MLKTLLHNTKSKILFQMLDQMNISNFHLFPGEK